MQNLNKWIIGCSKFLLSWGLTAAKHQNFCKSKVRRGSLSCFAIEGAWISRLLRDTAESCCTAYFWGGKCSFKSYDFIKRRTHAFVGIFEDRYFWRFPTAIFVPRRKHNPYSLEINCSKLWSHDSFCKLYWHFVSCCCLFTSDRNFLIILVLWNSVGTSRWSSQSLL